MAVTADDRWKALFGASRIWGTEPHFEQLLARITADALQFSGMEFSAVFLLEREGLTARARIPAERRPPPYATDAAQEAIRTARVISGHKVRGDNHEHCTIFCAPLTAARGIVGALFLESPDANLTLSDRDREFLETLALQAATAIEHANLYHSAITDPLTGLLTHRQFQQEVEHAVRRGMRTESPVSLLLLDLDHFKQLNDTCGHAAGNACLLQVSNVLKQLLRSTDVLARFGGDEFEVLLPDTPPESATIVAEKIRAGIAELKFDVKVTGTVGIAGFPLNATDGATLFLRADAALYQAKEGGRNRVMASGHREATVAKPEQQRKSGANKAVRTAAESDAAIRLADNLQEKIDGHVLVKRLGIGSNGEVLLVKQPELGREIALKRPLTSHLSDEQTKAFEQEARVTASLNHPGVVTVHTMGRDLDGRRYYTMKPLEGNSLAYLLEQHRAANPAVTREYSQSRLLEVLQRASETMAYAHQRGVVHLDLTPSNIVIGAYGEVTVIDWGCGASSSAPSSRDGVSLVAGSPRYLAPEQVPPNASPPGPAADVFALGAMLYEILTLRAPFQGATLEETLRLLTSGTVLPPEQVNPDGGIDPSLSELCLSALRQKLEDRPSTQDFTERLGRFVRREAEWVVTRFGTEHPLVESEWLKLQGNFELRDGEFVTTAGTDYEHYILWKVPVQGSFRFIAEGWLEHHMGELTLIGAATIEPTFRVGYAFHFAAEVNSLWKLTRTSAGIAAGNTPVAEPRRKYRIEMEYQEQEGWLRCYVDGKLVCKFREMFSFPGSHIGFYSFIGGAHIRPLEVHRQVWGLQVPAIRSADNLYRYGAYEPALERYREICERAPNRLEGLEARLKAAMSLGMLKRADDARRAFASLAGTQMEPYALAEQAAIEFHQLNDPWRAVELGKELLRRFPDSQAKWQLTWLAASIMFGNDRVARSATEILEIHKQLYQLGGNTLKPPTSSQRFIHSNLLQAHMLLGEWNEALTETQELIAGMTDRQNKLPLCDFMCAALANGRDDLLVYHDWEVTAWNMLITDWATGISLHIVVRTGNLQRFLKFYREHDYKIMNLERNVGYSDLLHPHLAAGEDAAADEIMTRLIGATREGHTGVQMKIGDALIESSQPQLLERWLSFMDSFPGEKATRHKKMIRSHAAFDAGDFERAAALHPQEQLDPRHWVLFTNAYVRQVMLASLGYIKGTLGDEIRCEYAQRLSGAQLELADMFFEKRAPVPTAKWPHHLWRVEWRLWLAMWLEAKGRGREAADMARTALDPRYGNSYSQPALKRLIQRNS